jgi:hypothetical protein
LLGTEKTVYAIRITATSLTERAISKEEERNITAICEHMLGVLRLTYDLDADFIRRGNRYTQMSGFRDEGQQPNLKMKIWNEVFSDYKVDLQNVRAVFCETAKQREHREVVRLCGDALHSTLPLEYRYLTLYKIFERDFKKIRYWQKKELTKLLEPFADEFRTLKLTEMKLWNFIIHLRDKCAHIAVGHDDRRGILGLESPDAQLVEEFMPLFWKIVVKHLNRKYEETLELELFPLIPPRRVD